MKAITLLALFILIPPAQSLADSVNAAAKADKDNFGQFVQKAAQDEEFRKSLPDKGYKNFGAWVSSQRKEGRPGEDAGRGKSDGHRRDGRGGGATDDGGDDNGGDVLGDVGKGNGKGRGRNK